MEPERLRSELLRFLLPEFPGIEIRVEPGTGSADRTRVTFVHESFAGLYPEQRYHLLLHAIPVAFYREHLEQFAWIELAPGERPGDPNYPDDALIADIQAEVLHSLVARGAFTELDELLSPTSAGETHARCQRDFRNMRAVLDRCGFDAAACDDIFHVLLARRAYCDCEILVNVARDTRFAARAWSEARHEPES